MERKITRLSKKGQLVIPKQFRKALGITEDTDLSVTLSGDGGIVVRPVRITPITDSLGTAPELRHRVFSAIERSQAGEVLDDEASQAFLRNPENFGNPPQPAEEPECEDCHVSQKAGE
jgi:AbrB family looped-hinge helix DNA binding protein